MLRISHIASSEYHLPDRFTFPPEDLEVKGHRIQKECILFGLMLPKLDSLISAKAARKTKELSKTISKKELV